MGGNRARWSVFIRLKSSVCMTSFGLVGLLISTAAHAQANVAQADVVQAPGVQSSEVLSAAAPSVVAASDTPFEAPLASTPPVEMSQPSVVSHEDATEHPLAQAVRQALAISVELQAADYQAKASDEDRNIARSEFLPQVALEGMREIKQFSGANQGNVTDRNYSPSLQSIVATQSVFKGGKSLAAWRRAKANATAGQHKRTATVQKVVDDVAKAYLELWKNSKLLHLYRSEEQRKLKFLENTQTRQNLGASSKIDVARAESQLASIRSSRLNAESSLLASQLEFERLTDQRPEKLADPILLVDLPEDVDAAINLAIAHNPQLAGLDAERSAAKAAAEMSFADFMPTFDIEARFDRKISDVTDGSQNSFSFERVLVGRLRMPLYQGGRNVAELRQAQAYESSANEKLRQERQQAMTGVRQLYQRVLSQRGQSRFLTAQIESAERIAEAVRTEYKFGTKSVFEVFDAEKEVVSARQSHIQIEAEVFVNSYKLLGLLGELVPERLNMSARRVMPANIAS